MKKTDQPIIVEENFNVSKKELWNAITKLNRMTKWFFKNIKYFEPKVGFETRFAIKNKGRTFNHLWRITEVDPEKRITYEWKYEGYEGNSLVTFELIEYENSSKLILTHKVIETFPKNIEEFKRESCREGWNWFIKQSLKEYLEE